METQENLWDTAKKVLRTNTNKYEKCINTNKTLKQIKEVIEATNKINPSILRSLWIETNKQTSMLWQEIMEKQSTSTESYSNYKGLWDNEKELAVKSLSSNGFYIFKKKINNDIINQINQKLRNSLTQPSNHKQQLVDFKIEGRKVLEAKNCQYIRWHYEKQVFEAVKELKLIIEDTSLKDIASMYLKCKPICTNKSIWISKGVEKSNPAQESGAAQMYHFDYDSFNFLKVMIYLSHVDTKSGPHTYIKASHKPFTEEMLRAGIVPYGRYTDKKIYSMYNEKDEKSLWRSWNSNTS